DSRRLPQLRSDRLSRVRARRRSGEQSHSVADRRHRRAFVPAARRRVESARPLCADRSAAGNVSARPRSRGVRSGAICRVRAEDRTSGAAQSSPGGGNAAVDALRSAVHACAGGSGDGTTAKDALMNAFLRTAAVIVVGAWMFGTLVPRLTCVWNTCPTTGLTVNFDGIVA